MCGCFFWCFIRHHIFCEIKQFENSKRMELRPAKKVKKRKVLAKERKRKGENDSGKNTPNKKLDTIEDHHNKHTIEDQGCLWTTPLKKCLSAVFNWVLIRHPIFWEIRHFWEFQKNGAKKLKKRKVLAKERKRKGENDFGKKYFQKKAGHNRGPPQQTHYWEPGLLMDYSLEKLFKRCFFWVSSDIIYFVKLNSLRIPKEWS